jgi:hypothetical protein
MQTKYYLSFEQVGIIRRIPLKEQDPDMQGILWRQLNPGSSTPEPEFINQFYEEVINRLKTKI